MSGYHNSQGGFGAVHIPTVGLQNPILIPINGSCTSHAGL